jgi:hypothetical protein
MAEQVVSFPLQRLTARATFIHGRVGVVQSRAGSTGLGFFFRDAGMLHWPQFVCNTSRVKSLRVGVGIF